MAPTPDKGVLGFDEALGLARSLCAEDRFAAARQFTEVLLAMRPGDPVVRHLAGLCRARCGDPAGAIAELDAAWRVEPGNAVYAHDLGIGHEMAGDLEAAAAVYRAALDGGLDEAMLRRRLAAVLLRQGRPAEARPLLDRLVAEAPDDAGLRHDLGSALFTLGKPAEAEAAFRRAAELVPTEHAYAHGLALALYDQKRWDEAAAVLESLLAADPDFYPALTALGAIARQRDDLERAARYLRRARKLAPDDKDTRRHLGGLERDLDNFDAALELYDGLLADDPDDFRTRFSRGRMLILLGRLDEGYREYDLSRWRQYATDPVRYGDKGPRDFGVPAWQGEPLDGRHILVWGEQGIGDEINFAEMIAALRARAARVSIECDPRLVPLFRRSFPDLVVIARDGPPRLPADLAPLDRHCPMVSLARWLHPGPLRPPAPAGFLAADAARTAALRARYRDGAAVPLIGISWQSGNRNNGRQRSAGLDLWQPLLEQAGARFVSLQYGDHRAALKSFAEATGIEVIADSEIDPLTDMDSFAAQVAAMDLVISIDNSTVHMAGALGRPVWTLLPPVPDARWQLGRRDTPWYATMRLYRADRRAGWTELFARVAGDLDDFVAARG